MRYHIVNETFWRFCYAQFPAGQVHIYFGYMKDLAHPDIGFDTSLANAVAAGIRYPDINSHVCQL